jgi:HAD superfamily hydrolase (TIGR01458 family)
MPRKEEAMIKGVLLDLCGVLYVGEGALPGAVEAVEELERSGLPVRFVTNSSRSTRRMIWEKLTRMGFAIPPEHIYTAPMAVHRHLREHRLRPFLIVHPQLQAEFADLPQDQPNAVVLGDAGPAFGYERLNDAFRLLLEGAVLLSVGDNRYFMNGDGLSLDVGPFMVGLEYAAGRRAQVLGKPAAEFFHAALAEIGCRPEEAVMIGDDAASDVRGAQRAGLQGLLVRTGKYRAGDEGILEGKGQVVDDVGQAVAWVLQRRAAAVAPMN